MNKQRLCKNIITCAIFLFLANWTYMMYDPRGKTTLVFMDKRNALNMDRHMDSQLKTDSTSNTLDVNTYIRNSQMDQTTPLDTIVLGNISGYLLLSQRVLVKHLEYKNFKFPEPHFISNKSRELFLRNKANVGHIGSREPQTLRGSIFVIRDGTYSSSSHDCGYKGNYTDLLIPREVDKNNWFYKAAPLIVPDGWTFQHFLDGILPKLMQAKPILEDPEIKLILMKKHRDSIIEEFLNKLNYSSDRIVFPPVDPIGADYLYYLCITPPLHPLLWQNGRTSLGAPEVLSVPWEKAYVVFVTRDGCSNCGRIILNQDELISLLVSRFGESTVRVFKGNTTLSETIELFGLARLVIGSHGGGMYNINFAPVNTTVIEIMPTRENGSMLAASDTIIWSQAAMLGQFYWRVCAQQIEDNGDMVVGLHEVDDILKVIKPSDVSIF